MVAIPATPKIYHITHVDNLAQIVQAGLVWSDAQRIARGLNCELVGISDIKRGRLALPVKCHPGTKVGEYVPFYFCPRSIMLYILHRGNHPDLKYRGGLRPIVHLVADLRATVLWANGHGRQWAFTDRNARALYADFFADLQELGQVNWDAISATDFRDPVVKDGKQAEFLVYQSFPWPLVNTIGVIDAATEKHVHAVLRGVQHQPGVRIVPDWYFPEAGKR